MDLLRSIYYAMTPNMRFAARRIYYFPSDLIKYLLHRNNDMTPPKGLIFIGRGDFAEQGRHICDMLTQYAGLTPESKVLDVGCGIGRVAVPLTKILSEKGRYDGFDIVKKGIDWCDKHIATKYQNFQFKHIDLKNDLYNSKAKAEAATFNFPYPDKHFNCVILTSVFTHMMPNDVDNYLSQIYRTMENGGKCLATFFILNDEIKRLMHNGQSQFQFKHSFGSYSLMDRSVKEANIAFEQSELERLFSKHHLKVEGIHYGYWSGISSGTLDFQDVVILSKGN